MKIKSLARRMTACMVCSLLAVSMVWAAQVSPEEAAAVANNFMNSAPAVVNGKKAPAKRMVMKAPAQQSGNQFYIYENASGEGWVMIAADDVARPVLAYSHTGQFRTENMPENIRTWLKGYNDRINEAVKQGVKPSAKTQKAWRTLRKSPQATTATPIVQPLIQTGWDQNSPYWNLCPKIDNKRCPVGCVATAMAQVMYYHQWPAQGVGSHTIPGTSYSANFGETTYEWDNMVLNYQTEPSSTAQKNAVATLMYHCGVAVDMNYDLSGSGAQTIEKNTTYGRMCAEAALKEFFDYDPNTVKGYSRGEYSRTRWKALLKQELDLARPIMYAGFGKNDDGSFYGHSFVCDGYDTDDYFHFNFGWSNYCDGFYDLDHIETNDPGTGGGNGEYNYMQDAIVGIQPHLIGHAIELEATGCQIAVSASVAENDKPLTATIMPLDSTHDFTSLTVKLGTTVLVNNTDYTLSDDHQSLAINAAAITGDVSKPLTITAVWTKNRCIYSLLADNCNVEEQSGVLAINAPLQLTILPEEGYFLDNAACWNVTMGENQLVYGVDFTYDIPTGTFSITQLTDNVTILAYGSKPTYWMVNGDEYAVTYALNDEYVLPTKPKSCKSNIVFVGWCAIADYESPDTAPEFVEERQAFEADTLYAVYALESSEGGGSFSGDSGLYTIAAKVGSKRYYAVGLPDANYIGYTQDIYEAAIYRFEKVTKDGAEGFLVQYENMYIKYTSPKYLEATQEPFIWTAQKQSGSKGSWRLLADTGRAWIFRAGSTNNFGCYATSSVTTAGEYYDLEIEVGGNRTYSNYTTSCSGSQDLNDVDCGCEPTAVKELRDGQMVIVRGDAVYTITGARLQ